MNTTIFLRFFKMSALLFIISLTIACNRGNKPVKEKDSTGADKVTYVKEPVPDSMVEFLVTSAAADFHMHQPPEPVDFRNIEIGYLLSDDGKKQYVLCGEFLTKKKDEKMKWETFATVKTSGYEQYLGGENEITYCRDAIKIMSDEKMLTARLRRKYASLSAGSD